MRMGPRRQAIALEYGGHPTPVVTAKAQDELAIAMIAQAREHGVYVTEDPKLLAMLSRLNVDEEVPPELFTAVAVILSWVYWLKGMRPGDEKTPVGQSTAGQQSTDTPSQAWHAEQAEEV